MSKRVSVVALAVVWAATAGVAGFSYAQVKVEDGRANDANSRVGSGGYNTSRGNNPYLPTPNDIALGNVTGGRGFRGNITPDPTQPFGGRSSLASDQIARRSSPNSTSAPPTVRPGTYASKYYSTSPVGNAPSNFTVNPYTGQYQAIPTVVRGGEDLQFGVPPGTPVIRPGADGTSQLVLPAVVRDANGAAMPTVMTATPLLGIRLLPQLADEDQFLLGRSSGLVGQNNEPLTPATLKKLREELRQTMINNPQLEEQLNKLEDQNTSRLTKQATLPGSAPASGSALDAQFTDPSVANDPLGTAPRVKKSKTPDPAEYNPLLAELRKRETERAERLKAAEKDKPKDDKKDEAPGARPGENPLPRPAPAGGNPPTNETKPPAGETLTPNRGGSTGGESGTPRNPTDAPPPPAVGNTPTGPVNPGPAEVGYVPPIKVGSLAERQSREGLKTLLSGAEKLMGEGKYATAADRYAMAMRYAPGDATIQVARSQAELGAGFFARAEAQLRRAVATDASVLGAQYDLRKMLGSDRVDTLVADLKKLAVDEKQNSMPVLLLAYIAYNGGEGNQQIERVTTLLQEAATRNGDDVLMKAMRDRWIGDGNK